ncbi:hypothetical protein BC943DRAFT_331389 [Umbelopsis sp. AD052]|nr:hypothetical protein BC943DRAFT_331389 [Umbelopsis sp. AD052]
MIKASLKSVIAFVFLFLYVFLYEVPVTAFNGFKNRKRDKYLKQILDKKFEELEDGKCLMLTQYFDCTYTKLFKVLETVEFNGIEFKIISLEPGARVQTEGLCFWRGEVKKRFLVPNTGDLNGGIERRFVI